MSKEAHRNSPQKVLLTRFSEVDNLYTVSHVGGKAKSQHGQPI